MPGDVGGMFDLSLALRLLDSSALLASYLGIEEEQLKEWSAGHIAVPVTICEGVRQILAMPDDQLARALYITPEQVSARRSPGNGPLGSS